MCATSQTLKNRRRIIHCAYYHTESRGNAPKTVPYSKFLFYHSTHTEFLGVGESKSVVPLVSSKQLVAFQFL